MRAAYYEKNGPARDVLSLGEVETPKPGPGEVRGQARDLGVNPSDVKAREGRTRKIAFPRVIPHSDGAGEIDVVGDGVPAAAHRRAGVDLERAVEARLRHLRRIRRAAGRAGRALPAQVSFEAGACLGIPAMTAYHAVEVAGAAQDRAGLRRRRRRRPLRHPVRQGARRDRAHHGQLARPRPSSRATPAPTTPSTTSARTSASG